MYQQSIFTDAPEALDCFYFKWQCVFDDDISITP